MGNTVGVNKKTAVVLGGTVAHRHLIHLLQSLDYRVVLVDHLPKPPAADLADFHIRESTLEKETVLKIATDFKAQLVLSPAVDQAHVTAAYCSDRLGLPTPIPFATADRLADKQAQKQLMNQLGIPTAKAQIFRAPEGACFSRAEKISVDFPAVVKPVDSNGSKGVSIVRTRDELVDACTTAFSHSRKNSILVEELNEGPEFNFYFWVNDFEPRLIFSKVKVPLTESDSSLFAPLSLSHPLLPDISQNQIKEIAESISSAAGISNGPLLIQANLDQELFKVIEFAPRLGGGLSTVEIQRVTGVDLHEMYLGCGSETLERGQPRRYSQRFLSAVLHLYSGPGPLTRVLGLENMIQKKHFHEYHFQRDPGLSKDYSGLESGNRILALHGTYSCFADAATAVQVLKKNLVFLAESGENLLRTDLLALDWSSVSHFFPTKLEMKAFD